MARMQRFEVSLNDTVKLLTSRAPLDSTAIYPITRSPNNHHETGKQENLSRSYLCLAHSTWARWWRHLFSSRWNTFLDCARLYLLDEDSHKLSSILNMGEPHLAHLHISITIKYMASFKNIESSIWPSWTCTLPWSILNLFFALHNDNVLKITVMTHSTFSFFKTFFTGDSGVYTPDTPATLGSTLTRPFFGSSLNITLVNTWSSFLYSPFHHETNIWSTSIAYGQILQV